MRFTVIFSPHLGQKTAQAKENHNRKFSAENEPRKRMRDKHKKASKPPQSLKCFDVLLFQQQRPTLKDSVIISHFHIFIKHNDHELKTDHVQKNHRMFVFGAQDDEM